MDVHEAARAWIDGYARAWKARDARFAAQLYAEDAVYRSHPFRDPHRGVGGVLDYTRWALSSQEDVDCWFATPVVDGDRAAIEYWAVILEQGGHISTLAGTVMLRFTEEGKVAEHRDYWVLEQGRRMPFDGWDA